MSLTPEQPFVRLEAVSKSYGSGSSTLGARVVKGGAFSPSIAERNSGSSVRDDGGAATIVLKSRLATLISGGAPKLP